AESSSSSGSGQEARSVSRKERPCWQVSSRRSREGEGAMASSAISAKEAGQPVGGLAKACERFLLPLCGRRSLDPRVLPLAGPRVNSVEADEGGFRSAKARRLRRASSIKTDARSASFSPSSDLRSA